MHLAKGRIAPAPVVEARPFRYSPSWGPLPGATSSAGLTIGEVFMALTHYEDFEPGIRLSLGPRRITMDEIVAFARQYDPQPMHTDPEAAKESLAGGLIASGWHSCGIVMRMIADGFILASTGQGAPGIEEVRWLRPVRPGDDLTLTVEVLERRPLRSRPEIGMVRFRMVLANGAGEDLLQQTNWVMFRRRDPRREAEAATSIAARGHQVATPDLPAARPSPDHARFLDDLVPGETASLGTHRFTPEEIITFARAYDPQPFHVDAEAAGRSLFGGLCASGWHTAAVWMKLMVAHWERQRQAALSLRLPVPSLGPSPGFHDLKWLKPVFAGDELTYAVRIVEARPSASRPGWGLVTQHSTAVNQNGEPVFAFTGTVMWQRAPAG